MEARFGSGSGFPARPGHRMHGVLFPGRRGAESKSSFDVCLNDFEWEKPNEGETRRENKGLRRVKSLSYDLCSKYLFRFQYGPWVAVR